MADMLYKDFKTAILKMFNELEGDTVKKMRVKWNYQSRKFKKKQKRTLRAEKYNN